MTHARTIDSFAKQWLLKQIPSLITLSHRIQLCDNIMLVTGLLPSPTFILFTYLLISSHLFCTLCVFSQLLNHQSIKTIQVFVISVTRQATQSQMTECWQYQCLHAVCQPGDTSGRLISWGQHSFICVCSHCVTKSCGLQIHKRLAFLTESQWVTVTNLSCMTWKDNILSFSQHYFCVSFIEFAL